jgi:hypothetical protein
LVQRDPRKPLDVKIRYRGGSEGWWLVEARGRKGAFPGTMALVDVMAEVCRTPSFFERDR